jgi:flavodoxin
MRNNVMVPQYGFQEASAPMPLIKFELPPIQAEFTEEEVRAMDVGRRQLKTEWPKTLYPPKEADQNWRLILPFANTYENAFGSMCEISSHSVHAKGERLVIFLNGTEGAEEAPSEAVEWVEKVGNLVAMKDFLAISFALDYDRHGGNPQKLQTEIGALRAQAKPYGGAPATQQTKEAADKLVEHCVTFLTTMGCYSSADCIVAMPPSAPSKNFNLPRYLAKRIAEKWGKEDLSEYLTGKPRNSMKEVPLAKKLDTLLGTIEVTDGVFDGRNVLLLDDLYQSGVSMNYCGLILRQAGAKKIFGLACEKTCRNDDNVGGKM